MTSSFRLFMSMAFTATALLVGILTGLPMQIGLNERPIRVLNFEKQLGETDIDRYVEIITNSSLFPNVETREMIKAEDVEGNNSDSIEALEKALSDPSLSAFLSEDGEWQILFFGDLEVATVKKQGDRLNNGWVIDEITPTMVYLTKDEERRAIRAYKLEPSNDEIE